MNNALSGILVVALEQAVAAPYCTSRLADAGARVIKIERAEGDFARGYDHVAHGESAYFVWTNRGKESVCLDIKNADDCALLARMIAKADVFIQNLAPGAAERAGFGSEDLRRRHPRLITCDISGYGEDGPYRDMKAYDLLVQSETGLAAITGAPEGPGRVGVSVADIACGMNAHTAILQALYQRERTGQGSGIALSLFDSVADWMSVPLMHFEYGGKAPQRVGLNHPSIAPYGAYACGDGRQVVFSIQNEREWKTFCEVALRRPDIAVDPRFDANPRRVAHRPELDAEIAGVFSALTQDQVIERLNQARIAFGRLNQVADLAQHSQLRRITTPTPSGPVQSVAPPIRWSGATFTPGPVPAIGQHDQAIRQEFKA
ncbi:CaiB/BaiF CoA-transferase family protein [Magnetospirillum sp. 64-120]|uniref:CaiB/BaiF CoA transferase family protein n=1 Tax=Magnetospirillum sp. 64-120 TaxID=1895778 RepID=UPI00092BAC95|nr:CaiB/BaiF CoA-transferase family protein [Magnetospirillum sp. 64-120]OJX74345.1 MAG: carnitine dehydratase [Magnetospirillum sp. 64-120]